MEQFGKYKNTCLKLYLIGKTAIGWWTNSIWVHEMFGRSKEKSKKKCKILPIIFEGILSSYVFEEFEMQIWNVKLDCISILEWNCFWVISRFYGSQEGQIFTVLFFFANWSM